jgi:hypothetical protein
VKEQMEKVADNVQSSEIFEECGHSFLALERPERLAKLLRTFMINGWPGETTWSFPQYRNSSILFGNSPNTKEKIATGIHPYISRDLLFSPFFFGIGFCSASRLLLGSPD